MSPGYCYLVTIKTVTVQHDWPSSSLGRYDYITFICSFNRLSLAWKWYGITTVQTTAGRYQRSPWRLGI